jgi:hypothetical protein
LPIVTDFDASNVPAVTDANLAWNTAEPQGGYIVAASVFIDELDAGDVLQGAVLAQYTPGTNRAVPTI